MFDGGNLTGAVFAAPGRVSFQKAQFMSHFGFNNTVFDTSYASFDGATFVAGTVRFGACRFGGELVSFADAEFRGAEVTFLATVFASGMVTFKAAQFAVPLTSSWPLPLRAALFPVVLLTTMTCVRCPL